MVVDGVGVVGLRINFRFGFLRRPSFKYPLPATTPSSRQNNPTATVEAVPTHPVSAAEFVFVLLVEVVVVVEVSVAVTVALVLSVLLTVARKEMNVDDSVVVVLAVEDRVEVLVEVVEVVSVAVTDLEYVTVVGVYVGTG